MLKIIDEMSELIYVVDIETYELLYINRAGRESFGVTECRGLKCYEVLQGYSAPCSFCTNRLLTEEVFYIWERSNPVTRRHYLLKDRIVDWKGRKARLEIAFDMTEKEAQQTALRNELEAEKMISLCAKELSGFDRDEGSLERTLERIGIFLHADRTYLFQNDTEITRNTHEWCAGGVAPEIKNLQNVPISVIDRWLSIFAENKPVIIHDLEQIRTDMPEEYGVLSAQSIHSLIASPLWLDGECIGYIGVDNFSVPLLSSTMLLLTSISHFVSSALYRQRTIRQLEFMGYYDGLTGLRNRNAYLKDLADSPPGRAGVIYIDVNGIKQINDSKGHRYGDHILADCARTLRECLPGEFSYRVGGDEFTAILREVSCAEFIQKVQGLKEAFAQKGEYTVAMGCSWNDSPDDIKKLLFDADEDMYTDKRMYYRRNAYTGRYRHHLDDILNLTLPEVLDQMIAAGNFVVYYQPRFAIRSGRLTGAEALVRCQANNGVLYKPDQFIPVLEYAGTIDRLDFHVFEQVCIQLAKWRERGDWTGVISANFSRHTINTDGFADRLSDICRRHRIPLAQIEIEITETVETGDRVFFAKVVELLRRRQFRVSIDDFGVEHANLLLLTDIHFDVLKIDKHITDNIVSNKRAEIFLGTLFQACREIGVHVVAEGIETQAQLNLLRRMGCGEGQGYLFSEPVSGRCFEKEYLLNRKGSQAMKERGRK